MDFPKRADTVCRTLATSRAMLHFTIFSAVAFNSCEGLSAKLAQVDTEYRVIREAKEASEPGTTEYRELGDAMFRAMRESGDLREAIRDLECVWVEELDEAAGG